MTNFRYLFFGDSITYGAIDVEGGWVDRLKRVAMKEDLDSGGNSRFQIVNLGIGGDTSRKMLERIDAEIAIRALDSWEFQIAIGVGINDSRILAGETDSEVPLTEFVKNYERLIGIARAYSKNVITVGLTDIAEDEVAFKDMRYLKSKVVQYDAEVKRISLEQKTQYISLLGTLGPDDFFLDGLHPNTSGHEKIFQKVKSSLKL